MRITIVGGGNIGTQFAVHCSEKGHDVTVFTSNPNLFSEKLIIVDENNVATHEGRIRIATSDAEVAFRNAEMIIVTFPASAMNDIAKLIFNHTDKDAIIGVVPANGGSECAFKKSIERGNPFWGLERVPAIARLVKKGECVRSVGYRKELHLAALPNAKATELAKIVEDIFDINTTVIPGYLNLTLTPSNPILHTTRLKTIFSGWEKGVYYSKLPLFYEDWDDDSSALLIACDEEVQNICVALPDFNLRYVRSLKEHYESPTIQDMTRKISSITAFKGLETPAVHLKEGLVPDLHSRYFTADFSFGLTIIKQVADLAGVETPNIDETMKWYKRIAVEKAEFHFRDYGLEDIESFRRFYLQ